jgi:hypothetical protein
MGMACIVPNWNQLRDDCFPMLAMPIGGSSELSFQDLRDLANRGYSHHDRWVWQWAFPRVFLGIDGYPWVFRASANAVRNGFYCLEKYGDHLRQQKRRKRMAAACIKAHEIPSKSRRGLGIDPEGIPT